jgi:hypothetical protein
MIEINYYEVTPTNFHPKICGECGSYVMDPATHSEWHCKNERTPAPAPTAPLVSDATAEDDRPVAPAGKDFLRDNLDEYESRQDAAPQVPNRRGLNDPRCSVAGGIESTCNLGTKGCGIGHVNPVSQQIYNEASKDTLHVANANAEPEQAVVKEAIQTYSMELNRFGNRHLAMTAALRIFVTCLEKKEDEVARSPHLYATSDQETRRRKNIREAAIRELLGGAQ